MTPSINRGVGSVNTARSMQFPMAPVMGPRVREKSTTSLSSGRRRLVASGTAFNGSTGKLDTAGKGANVVSITGYTMREKNTTSIGRGGQSSMPSRMTLNSSMNRWIVSTVVHKLISKLQQPWERQHQIMSNKCWKWLTTSNATGIIIQ